MSVPQPDVRHVGHADVVAGRSLFEDRFNTRQQSTDTVAQRLVRHTVCHTLIYYFPFYVLSNVFPFLCIVWFRAHELLLLCVSIWV